MFACIFTPESAIASETLLDCAKIWSPRVEKTDAQTITLDIGGLERLWGSYADIAKTISRKVRDACSLSCNIALASTPDTAIHAARGFSGITIFPRGLEAKRLQDLPIEVLRPPENIRKTLDQWGIRTFGALAALPADEVAVRLGDTGLMLQRQAAGHASRVLVPHQVPLRFEESMDLDYELTLLEPLSFILSGLLGRLCTRMKSRNFAAQDIHLKLGSIEYSLRLPIPTQDARLLLKLLQLDLEARPPRTAVSHVTVEAIHVKSRSAQQGLFVPLSPEPEKLELTLARIAGIVGQENVGVAELLDTHRPRAFRMHRFLASLESRQVHPRLLNERPLNAVNGLNEHAALAFRVYRPPRESTVTFGGDGRPRWLAFHDAFGPILSSSGPWKTSGDWWGNSWDRDEWDVEMSSSRGIVVLYLIYCDRQNGRWYVEGIYD